MLIIENSSYVLECNELYLVFGSMDSGVEHHVEGTLNGENWIFG